MKKKIIKFMKQNDLYDLMEKMDLLELSDDEFLKRMEGELETMDISKKLKKVPSVIEFDLREDEIVPSVVSIMEDKAIRLSYDELSTEYSKSTIIYGRELWLTEDENFIVVDVKTISRDMKHFIEVRSLLNDDAKNKDIKNWSLEEIYHFFLK